MDETAKLKLPYILAQQAQKHVTHNEAIRALDAIVQLGVVDRDLATPPSSPTEGASYIVAASPTGAWAGHTLQIAAYQDAAWMFYPPNEGWIAWVADENVAVVYDGTAWITLSSGGGGGVTDHGALTGLAGDDHLQYHTDARGDLRYTPINPATLGVNATADATNKLAVSSPAILLNHAGAGHQVKVNKNAATDTASFLFQTGFSGRAEIGLTGDDDFHFKVSPNGSTFNEAIVISRTTGACTFPNTSFGGGSLPDGDKGDITVSGSGATWTIDADTVTNAKLADMATQTFKGRTTTGTGDPEDLTVAQAKILLNLAGTNSGDQTITLTGDVTGAGTGSFAAAIANDAVTNAKLANVAAATLKGRVTAATGDPEDLTGTQATTLLDTFTSALKGLTPGSGGGTTNFLRADGTWAAPAGGGGGQSAIQFKDEGANLGTPGAITSVDFVGAGVTASEAAGSLTVTISCGGGGGDAVSVNGAAATDADFNDATPAPPRGGANVHWQKDSGTPNNVSAHILFDELEKAARGRFFFETDFFEITTTGNPPWTGAAISSGTANATSLSLEADHPGFVTLRSSTTASSGYRFSTTATALRIAGGEQFDIVFRTPTTNTNNNWRLGFIDSFLTADQADGCYFEMTAGSLNVVGKTANNSTRTTSATIASLSASTWYHGRIKVNADATAVDFTIYDNSGTQLGTQQITTNIPTGAGRETGSGFVVWNTGTTASDVLTVDYMAMSGSRTMTRGFNG